VTRDRNGTGSGSCCQREGDHGAVALLSGGKRNGSAGATAACTGRTRGKSVTAAAKNFGRKSKEERPPASPSAMGNKGGGGVPALTEKIGKKVGVWLLYAEEAGEGVEAACASGAAQRSTVFAGPGGL
jgi:hypothetical protein